MKLPTITKNFKLEDLYDYQDPDFISELLPHFLSHPKNLNQPQSAIHVYSEKWIPIETIIVDITRSKLSEEVNTRTLRLARQRKKEGRTEQYAYTVAFILASIKTGLFINDYAYYEAPDLLIYMPFDGKIGIECTGRENGGSYAINQVCYTQPLPKGSKKSIPDIGKIDKLRALTGFSEKYISAFAINEKYLMWDMIS